VNDLYVMVEKVRHMLTEQDPAARRAQAPGDLHDRAIWRHQRKLIQGVGIPQDGPSCWRFAAGVPDREQGISKIAGRAASMRPRSINQGAITGILEPHGLRILVG
jgi:hypothetical protein